MSFQVIVRDNLSVQELVQLHQSGYSILRSLHAGFSYISNLVLAAVGLPIFVFDQNRGDMDTNYTPHRIWFEEKLYWLCDYEALMTHAVVTAEDLPPALASWFPLGDRVADCHVRSLRSLFPHTSFELGTDFVRTRQELYWGIVETLSQDDSMSALLRRYNYGWSERVSPEGHVVRSSTVPEWEDIKGDIFQLNSPIEGWRVPNPIFSLFLGIAQALDSGNPIVYHLSGPDMVGYMSLLAEKGILAHAYEILQQDGTIPLPEQLVFNLVPTADLRFAVKESRKERLDELIAAHVAVEAIEEEKRRVLRSNPANKLEVIKQVAERTKSAIQRRKLAVTACPEVNYRIRHGGSLNQFDFLLSGEPLYVHPWTLEMSIGEVAKAFQVMFPRLKTKGLIAS